MKRIVAIGLALIVLLTGLPSRAEDHLVSLATVQARLNQAAQRQADLTAVRSVLVSPAGVSAAAGVGLDAHAMSDRVAVLSDEELRDLAERAAMLRADPVAGSTGKTLLIIGLILTVLMVIVFLAFDSSDGPLLFGP